MNRSSTFLCAPALLVATFAFACGDSENGGGAGGSAGTTNPTTTKAASSGANVASSTASTSGTSGSNTASSASTTASGSSGSGTGCDVPDPTYDGLGCLDTASASMLCGFSSDEKICEFAVGCGFSTDSVGQCKINCEQGSSSFCNDMVKTTCVIDSFCTQDCTKLAGCGFIL